MVLEKVIAFISTQFCMDEDEISEDTTFESLGADEEDIQELVLAVEGEFEIKLHEDEVIRLNEVSDLVNIVETAISLADIQ
jgi:acyl carrier protein